MMKDWNDLVSRAETIDKNPCTGTWVCQACEAAPCLEEMKK